MSYLNRVLSGVSLATLAALVAGVLLATTAQADELNIRPTVELFEEFSTNPTRARDRDLADSAFALRYKPSLELETRGRTGFNRLHVGLSGREYHDSKFSERDATDRFADFEFQRALTSRFSVFGTFGYYFNQDVDAILVENEGTVAPGDQIFLTSDRPEIETVSGQFGAQYALTPKSNLNLSTFLYDFDYDLPGVTNLVTDPFRNRRDFSSHVVSLRYNRALSKTDSGFLEVSYRVTDFDPAALFTNFWVDGNAIRFRTEALSPDQEDRQYSVSLGWTREWRPGLATSLTGGTRFLDTERGRFHQLGFADPRDPTQEQNGNLVVFNPDDGDSTSFIGSASIVRTFKRGKLEVFASRETRPSSSISASIDETAYGFLYSHRFSTRLSGSVGVRNEFREAANENGFDDTARTRRYDASIRFRLRERWIAFVRANSARAKADNLFFNSYSDHRVSAGFRYAFDVEELDLF